MFARADGGGYKVRLTPIYPPSIVVADKESHTHTNSTDEYVEAPVCLCNVKGRRDVSVGLVPKHYLLLRGVGNLARGAEAPPSSSWCPLYHVMWVRKQGNDAVWQEFATTDFRN